MSGLAGPGGRKASVYKRFTDGEVARFKSVFLQFDTDGNGHIDEQELHDIMGKLGRPLQEGEAKKYIEMVDIDGSGVIYFEEFLQLLEMQIQDAEQMQQYKDLFHDVFNRSRSGLMSQEELRNGMLTLGHRLSDEEIVDMILEADDDEDGNLSFDEFRGMLTRVQTEEKAVSKRGWDHEGAIRVFELWAIILAEAPKLAEKNSLMKKCEKPNREFRRPSRVAKQKTRTVSASQKALQPEVGSAGPTDIIEVAGLTDDGSQAVYTEPVVINIEGLVLRGGEGDPKKRPKIVCDCKGPAVTLRSKRCFIENFVIENHGSGPAVQVEMGFPDITNCDVQGVNGGMIIRNRSHPLIRGCSFVESKRSWGILIKESRAIIENCTFSANSDGGIVVERSSNPWISECKFNGGHGCGVVFTETASGIVCHSSFDRNGCAGVLISDGANPTIWKNEIHHGQAAGISIQKGGRGHIEENELHDNESCEIEIVKLGNPVVRKNKMHSGKGSAVSIESGASGTIEHNEMCKYPMAGVYIGKGGGPSVTDNIIYAPDEIAGSCGVSLSEGSSGKVSDNLLVGWMPAATGPQRQSLVGGCAVHVGGTNTVQIGGNIARATEDECRAEKMVMQMGRHDLRQKRGGR